MIEDFKSLLDALGKRRKYSDCFNELGADIGLKIIHLPGAAWRQSIYFDGMTELIEQIFSQLPADAAIMDDDGEIVRRVYYVLSAGYANHLDRFMIIVGSKEWPVVPEEEMIPELEITIKRESVL